MHVHYSAYMATRSWSGIIVIHHPHSPFRGAMFDAVIGRHDQRVLPGGQYRKVHQAGCHWPAYTGR